MGYIEEIIDFMVERKGTSEHEEKAARTLLYRIGKACSEFSKTDRNRILSELGDLTKDAQLDELEGSDLTKACELTSDLSSIDSLERKLKSDTLTLIALDYLIKDASREQILAELKGENWLFKHEVLSRWAWLSAQKAATQKGRSFNRLYLCEVGPRDRRQNIDREFFIYLKFMAHYHAQFQTGYLLYEYNGDTHTSPDFISVNERGEKVGIEVTEATESPLNAFEAKQEERLIDELVKEFGTSQCHFTIWSRPTWSHLLDNCDELKSWLCRIRDGVEKPVRSHRKDKYFHQPLDLMVSFKPENIGYLFTDISGDGNGNGYEGDEIEYRIKEAVLKRVSKKFTGPPPSVQPCLLVIFDNAQLPAADYTKIVEMAKAKSDTVLPTHFEEIWLLDDQQCSKLK
jgi:hypothetical protein